MAPPTKRRPSGRPPSSDDGEAEAPTGKYEALDDFPPRVPPARVTPAERTTVPVPAAGPPHRPTGDLVRAQASKTPDGDSDHPTNRPHRPDSAPHWQELLDSIMDEPDGPELEFEVTDDPNAAFASGGVPAIVASPPRHASRDNVAAAARRKNQDVDDGGDAPTPLRPPPPPRMPRVDSDGRLAAPEETIGAPNVPVEGHSPPTNAPSDPSFQPAFAPLRSTATRPARTTARFPSPVPLPLTAPAGDAQSLVDRTSGDSSPLSIADPRREMLERHALGDFTGALGLAEGLLQAHPGDPEVTAIATECRSQLRLMFISRLGGLELVPSLAVPRSELKWLSLHHRAGFLLSLVDGMSTLEEIVDLAGMSEIEALRTLVDLLGQHVIELKPPRRR